jgi:serine/threonine protein kinase
VNPRLSLPPRIGRYEIELLLGEGATGRVLLAHDPIFRRHVALKVLRDDPGLTPDARRTLTQRVRQDACAAATLSHPAMVALHDMGDDERAGLYVVFELVRGPTLRERLHEGPLPLDEVAALARTIGSALTHAHAAGLVHRGVKPENIMLAPTGPMLTDFGFCQEDPRTTAYGAPESLASGVSGAPSDQFALAATMYEALTGRRAFPGEDPAAIAANVAAGKHAPAKSALPALRGFLRLDRVFGTALARDPGERFPSCDAFGSALAAALEGPRVTFLATPGPARTSISRATRRWQNKIALVAVAVIFALVLIGRFRPPATEEKSTAPIQRVSPASVAPAVRPSPSVHPVPSATSPSGATSAPAARPSPSLSSPPSPSSPLSPSRPIVDP